MKEATKLKLIFYFTVAYLLLFTVIAILKKNYEFLYYTVIISILIFITVLYHKRMHLSTHILVGLTALGVLHFMGGNLEIQGTRLYDWWIISAVLRYDMLVHAFGTFIATFVAYSLLNPHLDAKIKHNPILISFILVLLAMGMGAANELLEFVAVVFLGAAKQVGDYINNALDLLFNTLGSIVACFFIIFHRKKKHE